MGSLENVYISVDFGIKSDVFFHFWWVKTPALEAALADGKWKWYKTGLQIYHMDVEVELVILQKPSFILFKRVGF